MGVPILVLVGQYPCLHMPPFTVLDPTSLHHQNTSYSCLSLFGKQRRANIHTSRLLLLVVKQSHTLLIIFAQSQLSLATTTKSIMTLLLTALFFSQLYAVSSQSIRGGNAAVHQNQSVERKRQRKTWGSLFDTRIIGGSEANEGRYSFAVSMQDRIGHFCGGSLIAPDVVLSAAHCQGGEYSAVIGRHDLRTNDGDEIDVATELPHPDYDSYSTNNDFMLLFLSRPTTESVDFAKISPDVTSVGESVTVMGWGDTHISDTISELADELMEVEVKTISNNACEASSGKIGGWDETYNGQITENMMCAEESNRAEDACQGDSGGP